MEDLSVAIRHATPGDAPLLAELGARAFSEAFAALTPPADLAAHLARTFSVERLSSELADDRSTFLIASMGGEPAGYARLYAGEVSSCVAPRPAIELVRLYSLQPWWGRGVGAGLVARCLEIAHDAGYAAVWLSTWKLNDRANAFYRKWGFREVGEQPFVVGEDVQEDFIMARIV
jgi:predicted N-acetyltransferase YhbS